MRHLKKTKKFHRRRNQRRALLKSLLHNLVMHGRITTTTAKAKAVKPEVEKLITAGKKQQLTTLRLLLSRLPKASAYKIFYELAPRYQDRKGGYTRVIGLQASRKRDNANEAVVEFV